MKICHITTVHPRYDIRIFHKECSSLAKHYDVSLIVADGLSDEEINGVNIVDIGLRQSSRLKRARIDSKKALKKALELNCELYHFHDPELSRIGVKLKKKGKKVIYDTHEDLPRQIYGKPYLKDFIKPFLARFIEWQENKAAKKFDYICSATPFIRNRFKEINKNTIDINNFPIINELNLEVSWENKKNKVSYAGGISEIRGIKELVKAIEISKYKLNLAGSFSSDNLKNDVEKIKGWEKIEFHGLLSREDMAKMLSESKAGIVTFLESPNHVNAQPNKIFEYMSAGLPVIASNFKLWKEIVEGSECGICVNPESPKQISEAIAKIIENDEIAKQMGEKGVKAVKEKYNWANEEKKLIEIYSKVLNK